MFIYKKKQSYDDTFVDERVGKFYNKNMVRRGGSENRILKNKEL